MTSQNTRKVNKITLKRILFIHIAGYFFPIPRVHIMAEALSKVGYDVSVICVDQSMNESYKEINGVKVFNLSSKINSGSNKYFKFICSMREILKLSMKIKPDIIQFFSPLFIPFAVYLKNKLNCKLIYDCYEYWLGSALTSKNYHLGIFYMCCHLLGSMSIDGTIYVYEKNPTRKFFKILNKHNFDCIIYNVPEDEILPKNQIAKKMKNLFFSKDKNTFVIGYLGLVMQFKGYETAIQSMNYLGEEFKLLIIGDSLDLKFKEKIDNMIKGNNLDSRIAFTGIVSHNEALEYSKSCDIGLLLFEDSYWTKYSTPNKLFEYMALGVPVVATNLPNIQFFIHKYTIGVTISKNDPFLLAECIKNLKEDKGHLEMLSTNGISTFKENFTSEFQMRKLMNLYSKII